MKKLICALLLSVSCAFSQIYAPEHYENQLNVLRNLDIHPSFISDVIFVEARTDIESKHSKTLINSVQNFTKLTPMIRKILASEEVPEEILYLAMVESGLKSKSVSRAKAVGVWQFMQPTAKMLGLRIDSYVDERRDLVKSTHAAAQYLKDLKTEFGKWYLAILAYNCGSGKLRKAIAQAGTDELKVLIDHDKKYLALETRNYIRKILTLAFLSQDREFLLDKDESVMNYAVYNEFIKVDIPSSVALKDIAKSAKLDLDTLKKYNPQFKHSFTPPGNGYYMYIPLDKVANFNKYFEGESLSKVDTRLPVPTRVTKNKIYIVKSGDTLSSISKKYGVKVKDIQNLNNLKGTKLSLKQKLILPTKESKNANYQKSKNTYSQVFNR
ncbi:LysM peptidoglycan-binding domain-containing protein [Campylobacter sp. LR291e]|uniref:lytic transglycosylase domain-containing protein n=1 Tax=Campylobacter sp. LR291e TaxID=2593546 RepID=UPI00123B4F1F|nr:lytic transglycosylase domain-containing protein [Campylobacter sp. LR291e]KAA6233656.1 LysM peptidoglycan-binding domain-containing protein [Campylobacter sp. LR291e]